MFPTTSRWSPRGLGDNTAPRSRKRAGRLLATSAAALLPALALSGAVASPAFAGGTPPQISIIDSNAGSCVPTATASCAPGTGGVAAFNSAVNPLNGDVAVINATDNDIYLIAGSSIPEFGLNGGGALTPGALYLLGGGGTAVHYGALATTSSLKIGGIAFDAKGNLVLVNTSGRPSIAVIANSATPGYGYSSFTPGYVYQVATTGTVAAPVLAMPTGTPASFAGTSVAIDPEGDILVGVINEGIVLIDEQSAPSTLYGQALTPQTATYIAGSGGGTTQLSLANGTAAAATGKLLGKTSLAVDGYGNLLFATSSSSATLTSPETLWVLPATPGTAAGTLGRPRRPLRPGCRHRRCGVPGGRDHRATSPETLDGVAATSAIFNFVDAVSVDPEGNILVGDQNSSYAVAVIAESSTPAYDISGWTMGDIYTISGGINATATSTGPASAYILPPVYSVGYAGGNLYVDGYVTGTADLFAINGAPVLPLPTVTGITPRRWPHCGGTPVKITGRISSPGQPLVWLGPGQLRDICQRYFADGDLAGWCRHRRCHGHNAGRLGALDRRPFCLRRWPGCLGHQPLCWSSGRRHERHHHRFGLCSRRHRRFRHGSRYGGAGRQPDDYHGDLARRYRDRRHNRVDGGGDLGHLRRRPVQLHKCSVGNWDQPSQRPRRRRGPGNHYGFWVPDRGECRLWLGTGLGSGSSEPNFDDRHGAAGSGDSRYHGGDGGRDLG